MSDLISRADAMGAVQYHFNDDGFKGYDDGQKMMDRIKALPSANCIEFDFSKYQPRVRNKVCDGTLSAERVGEWIKWTEYIEDDLGVTTIPHWKCSMCDTEYDPYTAVRMHYCPNCGAKMKGGNDD